MQVYIEVSKNHNIPILEVIRNKFTPELQLLIRYYNYMFHRKHHEYEKMEEEMNRKKQQNSNTHQKRRKRR